MLFRSPLCWELARLHLQEGLVAVQVEQEQPDERKGARGQKAIPRILAEVIGKPPEKALADASKGKDVPGHVGRDGVHADDDEREGPTPEFPYVDNQVEDAMEEET